MNSKIEEISDPCQPNLPNMPRVVMEEVLKNLDCRSIFCLRKVCRDLRFSIDEIKPDLHVNVVFLELPLTTNSMGSYLENEQDNIKKYYMEHHKPRTGFRLEWNQGNVNKFPEITMEDAEILLKNPKLILKGLSIDLSFSTKDRIEYIEKKEDDFKNFYESTKSLLENGDQLLKTKEIRLQACRASQAAGFLKCIDPKSLKTISISWDSVFMIEEDLSELEKLKQWKNSEKLKFEGIFLPTPVESMASFKTISTWCRSISIHILNEVKELFVRPSKIETFFIESDEIRNMKDEILSNFGQFDSYNEEFEMHDGDMFRRKGKRVKQSTWKWLKDIPGSTKKLQIILDIGWEDKIKFLKV